MRSSEGKEFGELLGQFRVEAKLTQQKLADLMGKSRGTIVNWENGTYLPKERALVLELAKHLHLDRLKRDQLLDAVLFDPLGTIWTIPFQRNPFFTGREEILKYLYTTLRASKTVALMQPQALKGLGGIGKTHAAIEYAYRYRDEYQTILWAPATTSSILQTSFLSIATILNLPGKNEANQDLIVKAVKQWLMKHYDWLLILDNVEDLEIIGSLYPWAHSGHVIITTRSQSVGGIALSITLEKMEAEEGAIFLLHRAGLIDSEEEKAQAQGTDFEKAKELSEVLGGLPLALDQAAAYIEKTRCGLSTYLKLYHSQRARQLSERGSIITDHPESVTVTFSLAFQKVVGASSATGELLQLCAFLSPDAIPEEIITNGGAYLGSSLEPIATDLVKFNEAIGVLLTYSLVQRETDIETGTQILSVHRLVQAVLQDTMEETERRSWVERVMLLVNAEFPKVEHTSWPQCERLLSHALLVAQYIERDRISGEEAGRLLYESASYLQDRARYTEAEPLYLRALRIREHQLGPEHLDMAYPLNSLAELYREQGKYAEAEPLYLRALRIREHQLGPEHPDVAIPLNNLAILSYEQGKYAEVESLYLRVLRIWEHQLGPEHPLLASPLNGLAILYHEQGKYAEAEPLYLRVLQQLGTEHPQRAYLLNNLAALYLEQGRYAEAEPLYLQSLQIGEQQLGPKHPLVAHPLNGLANLYREQKKYAEAESLLQRAIQIREQVLGPDHPDTAHDIHDFALLQEVQGNCEEARKWYARALAVRTQGLGAYHPKTTETRTRFIALLQAMGLHEEAVQHEVAQSEQETSEEEQKTYPPEE